MKIKKLFVIVLLFICIFTVTGCKRKEPTNGGGSSGGGGSGFKYKGLNAMDNYGPTTGTISFQVGGGATELDLWNRLITAFEKKYPDIRVSTVTINDNDSLYTAIAGKNAPDVIQVESQNFGTWAKAGALQAIQPFVTSDNLDLSDYWEQAIKMYSFDTTTGIRGQGDLFCLPKDFGVNGIFVNRRLVDSAYKDGRLSETEYAKVLDQVNPMTYDEYIEIAVKLTQYDGTANSVYGSNRIYWESYLWSLGDDILDSNYKFNYKSENLKKVLQYSLDMVTPGNPHFCAPYTSSSSSASQDEMSLFTTGKIAMYWSGRWNVPSYDASNITYYCIPVPVAEKGDGTKGISTGWCSTIGYAIPRNSTKTYMAYTFIKFLASDEAYLIMNELNYAVPGKKSLITQPKFADPKKNNGSRCLDAASAQTFFELAKNARINNASRFTTDAWIKAFETKLDLLFTGDIDTVDDFLNSVRTEIDAALKRSDPQLYS